MSSPEGQTATEVLFKKQITITTDFIKDQWGDTGTFTSTSLQQVKADPGAKVSFAAASGADAPSLGYFFKSCTGLESIDGLSAWDVSNVKGESCMSNMFSNCLSLTSLEALSAWDVSNVTGSNCMYGMFYGCSQLTSLDDLSAWDVSKVRGDQCMLNMFCLCDGLTSLDGLSAWNVSNVTGDYCMYGMFARCTDLTSLDGLSAWNVSNVTGENCMQRMFSNCFSLSSLDGLSAWNVSNVTGARCMDAMFWECSDLTSIDALANWNITKALDSTDGVTDMFSDCSNIASITLGGKDGFRLSNSSTTGGNMNLPSANWWPVDNTSATTGIDTAALVTESQRVDLQFKRWQRCTSGSSKPTIDVSTLQVEWPVTNLAYTGFSQTITPTSVMADGTLLTPGIDFYVNYTKGTTTTDAMKDAGTYTATVNLRGAYKGNPATEEITIAKLNLARTDNRPQVYTIPSEFPYTGSPITPKTMVRVNVGSADSPLYTYLIENTTGRPDGDYTVTYANNENPGTATATVKPATSNPNLEGEASAKFQILSPPAGYVARDANTNTLTFSYSTEQPSGTEGTDWWKIADDYSASNKPGWTEYEVTKVTIDDSVKNGYKPKSMAYWFSNMPAATAKIVNLASLDTSAVTTMEGTFAGFAKNATSALTAPDLSTFNTQNVSNMASMFKGCSAFETLNISSFNTQNTENFSEMFSGATRLTTLDTSKLISSKAQTMASMFEGDAALETLDLSALTAPTILTTTASMFSGCSALSTLNLAALALGGAVTTTDMFKNCTALTEITLAKNFVFGTSTGFAFGGTASSNFWIADINTKMGTTAATWNTYLAALTANATSHTFTLATCTYTLDANGGLFGTSDAATSTLSYYGNEGEVLGTIATPTRIGWIQNNWWTAATGGSQVTIPPTFPAVASTTVYAHWNRDPNYAEVTFNTNGATQTIAPVYVQKGTAVTEPQTPTRENATFVFWSEDTGLQTPYNFATTVTQDMTLYARWAGTDAANTVAVIFHPNGGSFVQTQIVTRGESATRPANPTRDGATFDTWCEDTGLTEPYAFGPVQEETTVYARWSAVDPETTAIVTFNSNGGSFVESQVVAKGSTATRPANPTLANVTFDTWCQDTALEDAFDFASPIAGDTTLYARWVSAGPTNYSVVNFNTQGGSFVNSQVVANGSRATRPATIPIKEHYTFDNWYQDTEALDLWDFNSTIQEATTIYAGWTPVSYTITFNANGLTFQDGTAIKTEAVSYQDEIQAPELTIPADAEFTGWFTEPTGGEPMPDTCSGDATYYAHYTMVPPGPTPPGPSPEPTPDAGGDLVPITGDTLSASSWMFLAVCTGGIALTAMHLLCRKRSL